MTEQDIKRDVIQYLRDSGFWVMNVNSGRRGKIAFYRWWLPANWWDYVSPDDIADCYGEEANAQEILESLAGSGQTDGFLDIVAQKPGLPMVVVDTKTLTGAKRKKQKLMVRIFRRLGCISGFVRAVDECHRLIVGWTEAEAERVRQVNRGIAASSSDVWITKEEWEDQGGR